MGWSIENVRLELDAIFTAEGKKYTIQHPDALSPRVYIQHEGDISVETRYLISSLFPADVYIDYFPNVSFAGEPVKVVRKPGVTRLER